MNRRELLSLLGVTTVIGLPAGADEASGKPFRVGYVLFGTAGPKSSSTVAFEQRLRELGYVEGKTLVIEFRWLDGKIERYPQVMEELVRLKVDVIVTTGQEAAVKAAKQATATTPIVMQAVDFDPTAHGYVSSLARPGGTITGVFLRQTELTGKRLELLKEAIPEIGRVIILWDHISGDQIASTVRAAQSLKLQVKSVELRDPPYDYATALEAVNPQPSDALLLLTSPIFNADRIRLAKVALRARLPSMFANRQYTDAGGLISYAPNYPAMYRLTAEYVDKILRGAKPADLPVEQPTKFELVINLKTAKALGLTLPQSLFARADEVIE